MGSSIPKSTSISFQNPTSKTLDGSSVQLHPHPAQNQESSSGQTITNNCDLSDLDPILDLCDNQTNEAYDTGDNNCDGEDALEQLLKSANEMNSPDSIPLPSEEIRYYDSHSTTTTTTHNHHQLVSGDITVSATPSGDMGSFMGDTPAGVGSYVKYAGNGTTSDGERADIMEILSQFS